MGSGLGTQRVIESLKRGHLDSRIVPTTWPGFGHGVIRVRPPRCGTAGTRPDCRADIAFSDPSM